MNTEARQRFALFYYGVEFEDLSQSERAFVGKQVAAEQAGTYEYIGPVPESERKRKGEKIS